MSSIETFLDGMSKFCSALMPVAGLAMLIYLVLFVKELIATFKSLSITLTTVNRRLEQLDGPLHTVDEISQTIDEVHAAAKEAAAKAAQKISSDLDSWKNRKEKKAEGQPEIVILDPQEQESVKEEQEHV